MPSKEFLAEAAFISVYNTLETQIGYMQQWASSVSAIGATLQADPNYLNALSAQEQAAITNVVAAANALLQAVPISVTQILGPS